MAPIFLKIKGTKVFSPLSAIDDVDDLSSIWRVCTKVKSSLENGERLENLSWRLWHLNKVLRSRNPGLKYRKLSPQTTSQLESSHPMHPRPTTQHMRIKVRLGGKVTPSASSSSSRAVTGSATTATATATTTVLIADKASEAENAQQQGGCDSSRPSAHQPAQCDAESAVALASILPLTETGRTEIGGSSSSGKHCSQQCSGADPGHSSTEIRGMQRSPVVTSPAAIVGVGAESALDVPPRVAGNTIASTPSTASTDPSATAAAAAAATAAFSNGGCNPGGVPQHGLVASRPVSNAAVTTAAAAASTVNTQAASVATATAAAAAAAAAGMQSSAMSGFAPGAIYHHTVSSMQSANGLPITQSQPSLPTSHNSGPTTQGEIQASDLMSLGQSTFLGAGNFDLEPPQIEITLDDIFSPSGEWGGGLGFAMNIQQAHGSGGMGLLPPFITNGAQAIWPHSAGMGSLSSAMGPTNPYTLGPSQVGMLSPGIADQGVIDVENKQHEGPICSNCGATSTPLWRRSEKDETLCNACGLYYKLHNRHRPKMLRPNTLRKDGRFDDGGRPLECTNCKTTQTPLWRRDEDGNALCNACGLYYKLHKAKRPLSFKTGVIRKRQRFENKSVQGSGGNGGKRRRSEQSGRTSGGNSVGKATGSSKASSNNGTSENLNSNTIDGYGDGVSSKSDPNPSCRTSNISAANGDGGKKYVANSGSDAMSAQQTSSGANIRRPAGNTATSAATVTMPAVASLSGPSYGVSSSASLHNLPSNSIAGSRHHYHHNPHHIIPILPQTTRTAGNCIASSTPSPSAMLSPLYTQAGGHTSPTYVSSPSHNSFSSNYSTRESSVGLSGVQSPTSSSATPPKNTPVASAINIPISPLNTPKSETASFVQPPPPPPGFGTSIMHGQGSATVSSSQLSLPSPFHTSFSH